MRTEIKRDVLEVLEEAIEILRIKEDKDVVELKNLSEYTTKDSLVFQDEDSITIGILIYALYKLVMRFYANDKVYQSLMASLINARGSLRKDHFVAYRKEIKNLFKLLSSLDKKLKLYVQEVVDQAKIKKGFNLFEGGVSASKAANLMGVSKWELMSYIGHTHVFDREKISTDIRKRLAFTRSLFR